MGQHTRIILSFPAPGNHDCFFHLTSPTRNSAAYSEGYIDPACVMWDHRDEMPSFLVIHIGRSSPVLQSRANLRGHIRELPNHLDLDCAWLVESEETADEIRDSLRPFVPPEDGLVVLGVGEQAAWTGLREQQAEWLVQHL